MHGLIGETNVLTGLIEADAINRTGILALDGGEINGLAEIPQFHGTVLGAGGEVITVLGKVHGRDRSIMTLQPEKQNDSY